MTTISVIVNANKITGVVTEQEAVVGSTAKEYVAPKNIGTTGTTTGTQSGVVAEVIEKNYVVPKTTGTISTTAIDGKPGLQVTLSGVNEKAVPSLTVGQLIRNPLLISELISFRITFYRYYQDSFQVLDNFSRAVSYRRSQQETVTVTNPSPVFSIQPLFKETVNLSEFLNKRISLLKLDAVNILETSFKNLDKPLPDNIVNVVSNIYKQFLTPKQDAATVSDISRVFVSFNRDFLETIGATDDYLGLANIDDDQYATFGKALSDSANVQELNYFLADILKSEELGVGDGRYLKVGILKSDAATAKDIFSRQVVYRYNTLDYTNTIDTIKFTAKKGIQIQAFAKDLFDRTVNYIRAFADKSNSSDKISITNSLLKQDLVNLADALTRIVQFNRTIDNIVITNDTPYINAYKLLIDSSNIIDSSYLTTGKFFTDLANFSDILTRVVQYNKSLSNQVGATDDYLGAANIDDDEYVTFGKVTGDLAYVSEINYKFINVLLNTIYAKALDTPYITTSKKLTDQFNSLDTVRINTNKVLTDITKSLDNTSLTIKPSTSDQSITADVFARQVDYKRSALDYSSIAQFVAMQFNKFASDQSIANDVFARQVDYKRAFIDYNNILDVFTRQINYNRNVADQNSVTDIFARQVDYKRAVIDYSNIRDIIYAQLNFTRDIADQNTVFDLFSRQVDYKPTITDYSNTAEYVNKNIGKDLGIQQVNAFEAAYKQVSKLIQESFRAAEANVKTISLGKLDIVAFAEIVLTIKAITRNPIDIVQVISAGTAYQQNYLQDVTYVENGYVGTATTFT
jgi:hypothetical protein